MPFHHMSGQANSVQGFDVWILRNDIRHHTVGILFDEETDDGKAPKEQERVFHEHGPGYPKPCVRVDGVKEARCRQFVVGSSFQQHAHHDDAIRFLNEQPDENIDGKRKNDWNRNGDSAVMDDGIDGIDNGNHQRS